MEGVLDMAKVTSKGQVTIPAAIRRLLGIKTGDKVLFVEGEDGSVTMRNATLDAFAEARTAFAGAADEAGLACEQDVVDLVRDVRRERVGA